MTLKIIRGLFVISCMIMGGLWAMYFMDLAIERGGASREVLPWVILGALGGAGISVVVLLLLTFITQEFFEKLFPATVAIVLGMVMGYFLARYIKTVWEIEDVTAHIFLTVTLVLICGYVGIALGLTRASNWEELVRAVRRQKVRAGSLKIVDTSVIIDGRIADICKSGFIDGSLLVPRFVLRELQGIADSADPLRRARGRRGLDIIKMLQEEETNAVVEVIEDDPVDVQEVDGKLVRLASRLDAKILTNDFNLNKVAQIEGVPVLNINDLANALKPAVLPDEEMRVKIIKEGKEATQGVGYLDDGTMVVVEGGKMHLGRDVAVLVTSVLQTNAGRMIFAKLRPTST